MPNLSILPTLRNYGKARFSRNGNLANRIKNFASNSDFIALSHPFRGMCHSKFLNIRYSLEGLHVPSFHPIHRKDGFLVHDQNDHFPPIPSCYVSRIIPTPRRNFNDGQYACFIADYSD